MSYKLSQASFSSDSSEEFFYSPETHHIYLCAGGTGGHIFPALSVAKHLQNYNISVTLLCDKDIDDQTIPLRKLQLQRRTGRFYKLPLFIFHLFLSFLRCFWLFLKKRPDLVVGFGGYPSFSAVLAAQILRIPTVLHEQNACLGRANRYLLKYAHHLVLSFAETILPKSSRTSKTVIGNPIRMTPCHSYIQKSPFDRFTILILGGSQGAKFFSTLIPESIALLSEKDRSHFAIVQQCRKELLHQTKKAYEDLGIYVVETIQAFHNHDHKTPIVCLQPFFDDVQSLYEKADLVIARAGAATVFELIAAGRASLLIPYPFAMDNHQYYNAISLNDSCFLRKENDITPEFLSFLFRNILENPDILFKKAQSIHTLYTPNTSKKLAHFLLNFLQ